MVTAIPAIPFLRYVEIVSCNFDTNSVLLLAARKLSAASSHRSLCLSLINASPLECMGKTMGKMHDTLHFQLKATPSQQLVTKFVFAAGRWVR